MKIYYNPKLKQLARNLRNNHLTPFDKGELIQNLMSVRRLTAVRRIKIKIMAPGGGFFIGPTHNFQDDIPTENILAVYEAAKS